MARRDASGRRSIVSYGVTVGLVLGAVLLSGCSSKPVTDPYAQDLAAARSLATSTFEKDVLADGKIGPQDYEEAHRLWLQCMEGAYPESSGVEVKLDRGVDGMYSYAVSGFPAVQSRRSMIEHSTLVVRVRPS